MHKPVETVPESQQLISELLDKTVSQDVRLPSDFDRAVEQLDRRMKDAPSHIESYVHQVDAHVLLTWYSHAIG